MTFIEFHEALEGADQDRLGHVIDWIERPWDRAQNDRLRSAWHEARREPRNREALICAIERALADMSPRDHEHIARRLGVFARAPRLADVLTAVARRLGAPRPSFDAIVGPLVELAWTHILRAVGQREPPRTGRARDAGRRRGHHGRS